MNQMGDILLNKRTSICGLVVAVAVFFRIFWPSEDVLITKITEAVIGLVGALALFFAKDGNVSGTTSNPR